MGVPSSPAPAPTPRAQPLRPAERGAGSEGRREPSASLHRPRRREGGSGEGATQTVALGKLRPQFFQVLPEREAWGGHPAKRSALAPRPPPSVPRSPARRREPPSQGAPGRESRGREGGRRALPRVHTMRRRRRTPNPAGAAERASAARRGGAAPGEPGRK